jgi:undecaprenyl-diphosphatase
MDARERALLARFALLPETLVGLMRFLTHLGNGWLWVTMLLLSMLGPSTGPARVILASAFANLAIALSKTCFRRQRPASEAAQVAGSPLAFDRFSFPSGHTTNAFAWASCAASFLPELTAAFALLAALIGLSRVLLRVHFPSDVMAGAVLGWILGGLASGLVV